MWPFSTKEPLSPDKLPLPDAWIQRQTHDPLGRTMQVRANTAYSKFKGVTGYGQYVSLAVPMTDTTRAGFPNPGEVEELNRIENDLCEVLERNRESIFVGTTTIPGIREFIFYARDPDAMQQKFDNDVLARVFTHRIHLKMQPDPGWGLYQKLL
ncbi:DUF695 domain-containing protein [Occallatibacter savannae]|uniref:DUF695 domain-containing protein n=1 Tax=Occallatibacter savannae TaxID=1002691 RepID=UPI0013A5B586|nr:DUF695 domain-containing protein [Occallatibacter savannae]